MTPVDRLLGRLDHVRPIGPGRSRARCPAHHPDRTPSLAIDTGEDGRALVYCHAGCELIDIVRALGLELSDLFPRSPGQFRPTQKSTISKRDLLILADREAMCTYISACDVLEGNEADWHRVRQAAHRLRRVYAHAASDRPGIDREVMREMLVVAIIGEGLVENRGLAAEVLDRLAESVRLIGQARDRVASARVRRCH